MYETCQWACGRRRSVGGIVSHCSSVVHRITMGRRSGTHRHSLGMAPSTGGGGAWVPLAAVVAAASAVGMCCTAPSGGWWGRGCVCVLQLLQLLFWMMLLVLVLCGIGFDCVRITL